MESSSPLLNDERKREEVGVIKEFGDESRRLWKLAGPAIFTSICQYFLGALTQTFAGLLGDLQLAAVSVENSVIAGLAFGVMVTLKPFSFFSFFCALLCFFSTSCETKSDTVP